MVDSGCIVVVSAVAGSATVFLTGWVLLLKYQWDKPRITPMLELYQNRYGVNVDEGAEIGATFELRVHNRQATVRDLDFVLYWPNGGVDVEKPTGSTAAWGPLDDEWAVLEVPPGTNYEKEVTPEKPFLTRFKVKTQRPVVGIAVRAKLMDGDGVETDRVEVPVDEWPEEKLQDAEGSRSQNWFSWLGLG